LPDLDENLTLAELVTAEPALAGLLDRLGLDYCCGGQRPLVEAVDAAGLDLGEVLQSLAMVDAQSTVENWSSMGPGELVDHIESTHHAYLRTELPRLTALAHKVASVHGTRYPELADIQSLFLQLRADLEPHLLKEERILFPMIRQLDSAESVPNFHCGSLVSPIRMMLSEHDTAGDLLADLRAATGGYVVPDDGCASYQSLFTGLAELEADIHLHVHKENNLLFPSVMAAESALTGSRS